MILIEIQDTLKSPKGSGKEDTKGEGRGRAGRGCQVAWFALLYSRQFVLIIALSCFYSR